MYLARTVWHHGILFLDELTEFRRDAEEARSTSDLAPREASSGVGSLPEGTVGSASPIEGKARTCQ
jgi:hypothetical protein